MTSRCRRWNARWRSAAISSTRRGRTAPARASGCSARRLRAHPAERAQSSPPRSRRRTCSGLRKAEYDVGDAYPADHIREYTEKSLANLGVGTIDLQQFHVWSDAWASDAGWQRAVESLKREKLVRAFGISVNRWEPANVLRALDTGLIDSVQVVYNIFDQAPEDALFPYCREHDIAVIARVPFDEGSLTGTLTADVALAAKATGGTSISTPTISRRRSRASRGWTARAGRDGSPRAGAPVHPRAPGGQHDDSRDAAAASRRAEPGGQRRDAAAAAPARRAAQPPLGSDARRDTYVERRAGYPARHGDPSPVRCVL